jgi:ribosome-binding ATPase YchF (GTP1/OBG family)
MLLSDQVLVENNVENKSRRQQLTGDRSLGRELELLRRLLNSLEQGRPLIDENLSDDEEKLLRGYRFITLKPLLIVLNIAESDLPSQARLAGEYADLVSPGRRDVEAMCGKVQMELARLDPEEQRAFFAELGVETSARDEVVKKAYSLLGLISFLTAGPTEVRAWPIRRGTSAVRAAGTVHSDIERGFIRAEVTRYEDFIALKTAVALKAAGKTRLEGKEYVVQDGDEILFRFNV